MQVRELAAYLKARSANQNKLAFEVATVTSVQKVGMGDRYVMYSEDNLCHHSAQQCHLDTGHQALSIISLSQP